MTETSDRFACCQLMEKPFPDDAWPKFQRNNADQAVACLLAKHPEAKVVSDRCYCLPHDHPEFPDLEERHRGRLKFALVREVVLDRKVPVTA